MTYHASFQHFSPGYLLLGLSDATGTPIALPKFTGSMSLEDGHVSATAAADETGHSLRVDALVMSAQNTILANVTAKCPDTKSNNGGNGGGGTFVGLDLTLSSDTIFGMPLNTSVEPSNSTLRLTKANVFDGGLSEPVMVPCIKDIVVYNSLRTFQVAADGTLTVYNASGGPALCLSMQQREDGAMGTGSGYKIVTVLCSEDDRGSTVAAKHRWVLRGGQIQHTDAAGVEWCILAKNISDDNTTTCPGGPKQSYYTDPSADGACQSTSFGLLVSRCPILLGSDAQLQNAAASTTDVSVATNPAWTFDAKTGFLAAGGSAKGKCLGAVGPRKTNDLALTVKLHGPHGAISTTERSELRGRTGGAVAKHRVQLICSIPMQLTIGVATERDSSMYTHEAALQGNRRSTLYTQRQLADELATADSAKAAKLQTGGGTFGTRRQSRLVNGHYLKRITTP